MSGFVYIWRDRKHKRYYIGSHWGTPTDGYICSSRWMRNAYHRRNSDFRRRILIDNISDRVALYEEEQRWLNFIKKEEIGKKYYNLYKSVCKHWSHNEQKRLTINQKISKNHADVSGKNNPIYGKIRSNETKYKISIANKGRLSGKSNPMFGKTHSAETKKKLSAHGKIKWTDVMQKKMIATRLKNKAVKEWRKQNGLA